MQKKQQKKNKKKKKNMFKKSCHAQESGLDEVLLFASPPASSSLIQ